MVSRTRPMAVRMTKRSGKTVGGNNDGRNQGTTNTGQGTAGLVRPISPVAIRPVSGIPHGARGPEGETALKRRLRADPEVLLVADRQRATSALPHPGPSAQPERELGG